LGLRSVYERNLCWFVQEFIKIVVQPLTFFEKGTH